MKAALFLALLSACATATADSISMQCPGERKDFSVSSVDPQYLETWKTLFDESERLERTDEGKDYNLAMLKAHNAFYSNVRNKCIEAARVVNEQFFLAIAIVSKSGEIQQYLTMPPHPEYACYTRNIVGHHYPPPPRDHYPVGFMEILSENADTPSGECIRLLLKRIRARDAQSSKSSGQTP